MNKFFAALSFAIYISSCSVAANHAQAQDHGTKAVHYDAVLFVPVSMAEWSCVVGVGDHLLRDTDGNIRTFHSLDAAEKVAAKHAHDGNEVLTQCSRSDL